MWKYFRFERNINNLQRAHWAFVTIQYQFAASRASIVQFVQFTPMMVDLCNPMRKIQQNAQKNFYFFVSTPSIDKDLNDLLIY